MNKEINVLFKVMGGPEIGLGHVMRSLELANEIKKDLRGEIFFHLKRHRPAGFLESDKRQSRGKKRD